MASDSDAGGGRSRLLVDQRCGLGWAIGRRRRCTRKARPEPARKAARERATGHGDLKSDVEEAGDKADVGHDDVDFEEKYQRPEIGIRFEVAGLIHDRPHKCAPHSHERVDHWI